MLTYLLWCWSTGEEEDSHMGLWHAAVSHRGVLPEVEALPGEEEVGDVAELVQLRYMP